MSNAQEIRQMLKQACPDVCEDVDEYEKQFNSFCTECRRPGTNYLSGVANIMNRPNIRSDDQSMMALIRVVDQTSPELSDIFKTGYSLLCKNLCGNPSLARNLCANCEKIVDSISDDDLLLLSKIQF